MGKLTHFPSLVIQFSRIRQVEGWSTSYNVPGAPSRIGFLDHQNQQFGPWKMEGWKFSKIVSLAFDERS